ncbi:hypothetical protein JHD48_05035 [Sulfurimonas sp. SAG-AH-194-I05]|nr:hypothetical protein [Sulfurimonas sp. SAG-AH-194-I05]MDF1875090.1 hypothetical protein [Sulfurimonas sp. SAG-AH-194-I05]
MKSMRKDGLILSIFSKKFLFEKEVLNVKSEKDRVEIMRILSKAMVDDILKEHINFLHIPAISDFTLKHVINILFKEIANEWISYAIEELKYSKDDALEELQMKGRVKFIHEVADDYLKHYKEYLYENIAHSFIELLASISSSSPRVKFVNAIINSKLIANRSVLGINSFDQLAKKIKQAKHIKSTSLSDLKIKISDIKNEIASGTIKKDRHEALESILPTYVEKYKKIENTKLEEFDGSLKRVKLAIFNSLKTEFYKT